MESRKKRCACTRLAFPMGEVNYTTEVDVLRRTPVEAHGGRSAPCPSRRGVGLVEWLFKSERGSLRESDQQRRELFQRGPGDCLEELLEVEGC